MTNIAFGVNAKLITGYDTNAAVLQGLLRGDGDVTVVGLGAQEGVIVDHKARCLLLSSPVPSTFKTYQGGTSGVPLLSQTASRYGVHTKKANAALAALEELFDAGSVDFGAKRSIAPSKLAALEAAFEFAMKDPSVQTTAINSGNVPGWVSGSAAAHQYRRMAALLKPLAADFR